MQFVPICTFVDASFWSEVNRRKLNEWKLEESSKPVGASISICEYSDMRLALLLYSIQMIVLELILVFHYQMSLSLELQPLRVNFSY